MPSFFSNPKTVAALHSLWITGLAIIVGLTAGAMAAGQMDTPQHFIAYVKANAWAWAIANLVAPAIRAAQVPSNPTPASTPTQKENTP